jgi:acetate kinase
MRILVLNAGSSSQKACLYEIGDSLPPDPPEPLWEGKIQLNGDQAEIRAKNLQGTRTEERVPVRAGQGRASVGQLLGNLWSEKAQAAGPPASIDVAAHRIVNGGAEYRDPVLITPEVIAAITRMASSAPLHNSVELGGIEFVEKRFGAVPQVAVFDTGFHKTLPESAYVYPGPYEWLAQGIRRYGFHGINHQYCAHRAAQLLGRDLGSLKMVTCHLGNGCSLAAVEAGRSVDTTMGFTPLEGLMMGTRSGTIDPGILTYLMRAGSTGAQLDDMLNSQSGLLGISGFSGDMREIVRLMKDGNARARLAFDIFVHRLRSAIGAMIATLGGMNVLVFTGGIGENSVEVRAAACANFGYFGLELDVERNLRKAADADVASQRSSACVLVLRAQEDWAMAQETWKLKLMPPRTKSAS